MITHLFIYGTLGPGQARWPHLAPFVDDAGRDDSVSGALYDTGNGYPAALFGVAGRILGSVYSLRIDRLDECLKILDEVEGAVLDLFRRVAITTSAGVEAWAYEYCGETQLPEIVSGSWVSRTA